MRPRRAGWSRLPSLARNPNVIRRGPDYSDRVATGP
jgi:hypothetical protein